MGDQAAWFFVWIPRKEEEKRLIDVEKEKQIEAARLQQEEELKAKEVELKAKEEARIKEEEARVQDEEGTARTTDQIGSAALSAAEQQKVGEVVAVLQSSQSDWPPVDTVTDETVEARESGSGKVSGSSTSVRVIEVQEVPEPSPAPGNTPASSTEGALSVEQPTPVDIPTSLPAAPIATGAPSIAAPTSLASGLATLTTPPTEGDPPTPLAEKKLEQLDHEEILTLEEILNKELANLDVSGLTWQPSRDKTSILALFYVRWLDFFAC